MSEFTQRDPEGPRPELPSDWRLFLVDSKMMVRSCQGRDVAGPAACGADRDLANFLDSLGFDLAEVGELLSCLEGLPSECELRMIMGEPTYGVIARRVEAFPEVACVVLRPKLSAETDAGLTAAWNWAAAASRALGLATPVHRKVAPLEVLVIDQNPEVVAFGRTLARKAGCRSRGALSGGEALAHLKARAFDLVLLDDQIPGLGSSALERLLRERSERDWGRSPLVASLTRDARRYEHTGQASLEKPLAFSDLKELVRRARLDRSVPANEEEGETELPVLRLERWEDDRFLLSRLCRALVAQGNELAEKLGEAERFAESDAFRKELKSLLNGCEIVRAPRLEAICADLLQDWDRRRAEAWKRRLRHLFIEFEGFRLFAMGQGLLGPSS